MGGARSGRAATLLAAALGGSGVAHLLVPSVYEPIVPPWLPRPRALVYASGVVELASAAGLILGSRWGGALGAATLVGVWPANVQMALDARRAGRPAAVQAALWARVPLQIPMIRTALRSAR